MCALQCRLKMAPKPLEPMARRILKGVIFLEVAGVLAAYGLFQKMNSSRDFRGIMNKYFPSVLEVFYKSNEWSGIYGVREADRDAWSKQN